MYATAATTTSIAMTTPTTAPVLRVNRPASVSVFAGVVAVAAPVLGVRLAVAPPVSMFAGVVAVAAPVLGVRLAVAPSVSVFAGVVAVGVALVSATVLLAVEETVWHPEIIEGTTGIKVSHTKTMHTNLWLGIYRLSLCIGGLVRAKINIMVHAGLKITIGHQPKTTQIKLDWLLICTTCRPFNHACSIVETLKISMWQHALRGSESSSS